MKLILCALLSGQFLFTPYLDTPPIFWLLFVIEKLLNKEKYIFDGRKVKVRMLLFSELNSMLGSSETPTQAVP
jgi:hypothetical protein